MLLAAASEADEPVASPPRDARRGGANASSSSSSLWSDAGSPYEHVAVYHCRTGHNVNAERKVRRRGVSWRATPSGVARDNKTKR